MNNRNDRIRLAHEKRIFYQQLKEPIDHKSTVIHIAKELGLDEKKVNATIEGLFSHNIGIGFLLRHFVQVTIPKFGKFVLNKKGHELLKRWERYYQLGVNKRKGEYKQKIN